MRTPLAPLALAAAALGPAAAASAEEIAAAEVCGGDGEAVPGWSFLRVPSAEKIAVTVLDRRRGPAATG